MTARIDSDGTVTQLDGRVSPDEVVTAEDVKDPEKVARLLAKLLRDTATLQRRWAPRYVDFDDVEISSSKSVRLEHGFNGRARYSLRGLNAGAGLAPVLAQSSESDADTLVLDAYQPVVLYMPSAFTTTSATAQNTTLTFPVRSGEQWLVEYWGFAGCDAVNGMKYAIGAPTGSTVDAILDSSLGSATTDAKVQITAINTLTSAVHTVAGGERDDYINARISVAASGSITIQAASATAGDTTTIRANAALLAIRMHAGASTYTTRKACIRVEEAG